MTTDTKAWRRRLPCALSVIAGAVAAITLPPPVSAAVPAPILARLKARDMPVTTCDTSGIGQAKLISDLPTLPTTTPPNDTSATITSVSTGTTTNGVPYCLVKVLVQPAINIWVGLPTGDNWNGRLQSEGGGGFGGSVKVPVNSISTGYVGVQTDTGHVGNTGTFAMATPAPDGTPNVQLQTDFAYRSEHLMAVIGKQLIQAFYGKAPEYAYWNGCSTGGRQGLMMAMKFPSDYNGILAGAPAVYFDRLGIYQIWPQVPSYQDIPAPMDTTKVNLAVTAAIAACDANDGVVDGVITDPRTCTYNPVNDPVLTKANCSATDDTCLSPAEAGVIMKVWQGPVNAQGKSLGNGYERGATLDHVASTVPQDVALGQGQYWVTFDPSWGPQELNYDNIQAFTQQTMEMMNPLIGSDSPDLSAFRNLGGKIVMWQGFADYDIPSEDSIDYYDSVNAYLGGGYAQTQQFYRHFMAPGVGHCGGGAGPQPTNQFQAVVNWVETGVAPDTLTATKTNPDGSTQTRPLCPYPAMAKYVGGDSNSASSFVCSTTP